ncbi:MAG TPA: NAD(+) kinase, partial [Methanosarcinales archaeon]|nr:NAD(+) kinase [Methanosarcinales archaeon]
MVKSAAIVSRYDEPNAIRLAGRIQSHLESKPSIEKIIFDRDTASGLGTGGVPIEEIRADLLIVIGGDGTILRTIQKLKKQIPILGVNFGAVGFLADATPKNAFATIDEVLADFRVEKRMRLAIHVNGDLLPYATNEAVIVTTVIVTTPPAKMFAFRILVDDHELDKLRADGIVIATPTGSTAYAMSAGGPIVDPMVDGVIIVPLAPYKLSSRPWVVCADSEIIVEPIHAFDGAAIVIDGQHKQPVHAGDIITITKAEEPALFVKTGWHFYERVRS